VRSPPPLPCVHNLTYNRRSRAHLETRSALTRMSQVLYSGPMFQVYNTVLRQYPEAEFRQFQKGGNLFPTTIFVLESAVLKLARAMRLPPGLELFRGLGGLAELPDSFYQADADGNLGYLEFGFLSTTSHRETAVEYSGAGEGKPLPMVLQTRASSIDRGACIKDFSQYPGEVRAAPPARLRAALRARHFWARGADGGGSGRRWSTSGRPSPTSSRVGRRTWWRAGGGS
jgi:hypothetical protein